MKFHPLHDYALVLKLDPPATSMGIIMPDNVESKLPMGRIVELGPEFEKTKDTCSGVAEPSGLKEGDIVIYSAGMMIQPPGSTKVYRLMRRSQILAKIEGAEDLEESSSTKPLPEKASKRFPGVGMPTGHKDVR